MKRLLPSWLAATGNAHKLAELRAMLSGRVVLTGLDTLTGAPAVIEDGETFEANAVKKAMTLSRFSGMTTLADDSGLEVAALNGAPGVFSARYAGPEADDQANREKLLRVMRGLSDRRAWFRCVLALCEPDGICRTVEGRCEGYIAEIPRGEAGFGYDPLFVPHGHSRTFAEMPAGLKNRLSHRARALDRARSEWLSTDQGSSGSGM